MRRLSSSINSFKPGAVGDGSEAGHQWLAKESAGPLRTRKVRFRREPALRRVFIDGVREFAGQPREQLFSRQSCLFRQSVQHLRTDRLFKLGRRDRFIGARFNPRLGGFALTALRRAVQELTESAVQDPSGTGTAETPAQLTEQATDPTLPGICGYHFARYLQAYFVRVHRAFRRSCPCSGSPRPRAAPGGPSWMGIRGSLRFAPHADQGKQVTSE